MRFAALLSFLLLVSSVAAETVDVKGDTKIVKEIGSESALDIHLDISGKAMRFYNTSTPEAETYFNDKGAYYSRLWMVISGTTTGAAIDHPSDDPFMFGVWSDIDGPSVQVRASASAGSYNFSGLDKDKNYTFSIEADGALQWGATTYAAMDVGLARDSAGVLKVTDAADGGGSLTVGDVLSITPKATAPATCTAATDIYSDTSGALCFCATTNTWEKLNATGSCA